MKIFHSLANKKQSMKHKLFGYMLILAIFLIVFFLAGLFLLGKVTSLKKETYNTLDFQGKVFEQQLNSYCNDLAVMGIQLSENTTHIIEDYINKNGISFKDFNGSKKNIEGIQPKMFDMLNHKLLETDCSGAFIILDATINPGLNNADRSKTGIYLQQSNLDFSDNSILLYRGSAEYSKSLGIMPHRKWRLEFNANTFPNYDELMLNASLPLSTSCRITDIITLPGTSERVMLFTVPIIGSDGTVYGLCGFEISESYFKNIFAQPSNIKRAVFCLNKDSDSLVDAENSFSCGITSGYYLAPKGKFSSKAIGKGLQEYKSDDYSYIGISSDMDLHCGNQKFSVTILMPKQDYIHSARYNALRIALLILLLAIAVISCCNFFSRHYLLPIKEGLKQIHSKEYEGANSNISKIEDLFEFLAEQDHKNEIALVEMETALSQIKDEYNEAQQKISRLAYSRKNEVDPDNYKQFCNGIKNLSPTESLIFNYYLEGKKVKEIMELTGTKESTIRFHNRNIYSKLGVNSLKQLLLYATILKQKKDNEQ